jgi:hypothetical protein
MSAAPELRREEARAGGVHLRASSARGYHFHQISAEIASGMHRAGRKNLFRLGYLSMR